MDKESLNKEEFLLKAREEAESWLDKEQLTGTVINFHESWKKDLTRWVTSDKFVRDHDGYLVALGELRAHERALEAILTASQRVASANRALAELKEATEADGA